MEKCTFVSKEDVVSIANGEITEPAWTTSYMNILEAISNELYSEQYIHKLKKKIFWVFNKTVDVFCIWIYRDGIDEISKFAIVDKDLNFLGLYFKDEICEALGIEE